MLFVPFSHFKFFLTNKASKCKLQKYTSNRNTTETVISPTIKKKFPFEILTLFLKTKPPVLSYLTKGTFCLGAAFLLAFRSSFFLCEVILAAPKNAAELHATCYF